MLMIYLLKDMKLVIHCSLAKHMATITTSTTRGILYANTKNTIYSEYLLGLIDMDEMIKEDFVIDV